MSWFEWAIIAFIVLSILWHVWKGGAANPHSTGDLAQKVGSLSGKVGKLDTRVGQVEGGLKELKEGAATTKDIEHLEEQIEEKIKTVRTEMLGHKEVSDATNRSVGRIEKILIERALDK